MQNQEEIKPMPANEIVADIPTQKDEIEDVKKNETIEKKSVFARAKEIMHKIFSSIRCGFRRAFYWLKSKFSTRNDDIDV